MTCAMKVGQQSKSSRMKTPRAKYRSDLLRDDSNLCARSKSSQSKASTSDCITLIDDDIEKTINEILTVTQNAPSGDNVRNVKKEMLCQAFQCERNRWQTKSQTMLHSVDQSHKEDMRLQKIISDIIRQLALKELPAPDENKTVTTVIMLEHLRFETEMFKDINAVKMAHKEATDHHNYETKQMNNYIKTLLEERDKVSKSLAEKSKESMTLMHEIHSGRKHIRELHEVFNRFNKNKTAGYRLTDPFSATNQSNTTHVNNQISKSWSKHRMPSEGTFMDERLQLPTPRKDDELRETSHMSQVWSKYKYSNDRSFSKERTFIEEKPQLQTPRTREELAVVKVSKKAQTKTSVSQCLRCHLYYKTNENSKKACVFHAKGREMREIYDEKMKVFKVSYSWACCKRNLDGAGCNHGYHI